MLTPQTLERGTRKDATDLSGHSQGLPRRPRRHRPERRPVRHLPHAARPRRDRGGSAGEQRRLLPPDAQDRGRLPHRQDVHPELLLPHLDRAAGAARPHAHHPRPTSARAHPARGRARYRDRLADAVPLRGLRYRLLHRGGGRHRGPPGTARTPGIGGPARRTRGRSSPLVRVVAPGQQRDRPGAGARRLRVPQVGHRVRVQPT